MKTGTKSSLPTASGRSVRLGRIAGVFGVHGEVRLFLENRDSDYFEVERDVTLVGPDGSRRAATVRARPGAGGRVIAKISGVSSREQAHALIGVGIEVSRDALPAPAADEFYHDDVIGLQVWSAGGPVGRVVAVHATGPVEVLELDGGRYVPVTSQHIARIDLAAGRVEVHEGAVAV